MAHTAGCDICRRDLARMRNIKGLCGQIEVSSPSDEKWGDFSDRLWMGMARQKSKATPKRLPQIVRRGLAMSWIATVCALTFLFYPRSLENVRVQESVFILDVIESRLTAEAIAGSENAIEHIPVPVVAAIRPYPVDEKIRGLAQAALAEAEREFLYQNGFVVTSREFPSFVSLYRDNQKEGIPSFVTIDASIFGITHIWARLRVDLEREIFYVKLKDFTLLLAEELIALHNQVPPSCAEVSWRALAFVRVADLLLGSCGVRWPPEIESKIRPVVEQEIALIINGGQPVNDAQAAIPVTALGIQKSPIFGSEIDYKQFKIRWNEAKEERLRQYYRALEWYNRCVFRSSEESETRSALLILMAAIGDSGEAMYLWQEMNQMLTIMCGEPDDPHFLDYLAAAREVYGDSIGPSILGDRQLLERFCRKVSKARPPRIRSEVNLNTGLRIFGERSYERDLYLQQLAYPYVGSRTPRTNDCRWKPSVVDLAVILGNSKAEKIARQKEFFEYDKYEEKVTRYRALLQNSLRMQKPWERGGFIAQAWFYETVMHAERGGYPIFAYSPAWDSRKLTSVLCGILNLAEVNSVPVFTGESQGYFHGIVDPYPEYFNRLATHIRYLATRFSRLGYPLERPVGREFLAFCNSLQDLAVISRKALAGNEPSAADQESLRNFALGWEGDYAEANLNEVSTSFHRNEWEADVYFYVGVESVREIWVACPGPNGPYLARGGIYLLYEFPTGTKILPQQWREQQLWHKLKNKRMPWIKEYTMD